MTTGVILGTAESTERVIQVALKVGFVQDNTYYILTHLEVDKLGLQIHQPNLFEGVEGIVTEMEFDDHANRFPNNPKSIEVLRQMYGQLPDLVYRSLYLVGVHKPTVIRPVSDLTG